MSKTVSGVTTNYLLDGDEEIAEYSGTTVLRRYITGPGVDDRIAHVEGTGASAVKTFYHANHQGSVMAMTDGAGNIKENLSYDEYGNGTPATGEQFAYTGRRFDPETGLYYYRARYYAPQLGRFLQTDPLGYKDNINLYTYANSDPVDLNDPNGESADNPGDPPDNGGSHACAAEPSCSFIDVSGAYAQQQKKKAAAMAAYIHQAVSAFLDDARFSWNSGWPGGDAWTALTAPFSGYFPVESVGIQAVNVASEAAAKAEPTASIIARIAQAHADSGVAGLGEYMSAKELAAVQNGSRASAAILGQAVHSATAAELARVYPGEYLYFPRARFDFLHVPTGELFELTTFGQMFDHIDRPGYLVMYSLGK